jgi:phage-related protein
MDDDEIELELWDFATSVRGDAYVVREMRKICTLNAAAKIERAMYRLETDTAKPAEYDHVARDVWELRVNVDNRWYRLLYSKSDGRYKALLLIVKKSNKIPPGDIKVAQSRV